MAINQFKIKPTIASDIKTIAVDGAVTDADKGKGVKLKTGAQSVYVLCAAGDVPEGFLTSVEVHKVGNGYTVCGMDASGYKAATAGASCNVGDLIEIHSVAAAGTADDRNQPIVAAHTKVLTDNFLWRIVAAETEDGTVTAGDTGVVIERI